MAKSLPRCRNHACSGPVLRGGRLSGQKYQAHCTDAWCVCEGYCCLRCMMVKDGAVKHKKFKHDRWCAKKVYVAPEGQDASFSPEATDGQQGPRKRKSDEPPEFGVWHTHVEDSKPASAVQENLEPGTKVVVINLQRSAMNNMWGVCERWDETRERWHVLLAEKGKSMAFKPCNLRARNSMQTTTYLPNEDADFAPPGSKVRIGNLRTEALNGQTGILEELDYATKRWKVRLANGDVKAFKVENLAPADSEKFKKVDGDAFRYAFHNEDDDGRFSSFQRHGSPVESCIQGLVALISFTLTWIGCKKIYRFWKHVEGLQETLIHT